MATKKRFLVTGGTGFLGSALVRRLVSEGHYVRILDNGYRSSHRRLKDIMDDIVVVIGDLRDAYSVSRAVRGVDSVVHLGAVNGTENFYRNPELVLDVGVRGMLHVLDACRQHSVGELVVASSSEVYQTPPITPTDETVPLIIPDPLNPRLSYGGSKIISELLAINYGRTDFDRVVIFRPHNVYGPDMGWEHVLPQFILRAKALVEQHTAGKIPFSIQGDGSETRAFTYIDDMVDGLMLLIEQGAHNNIYHVGNPEEIAIENVAHAVVAIFGRDAELVPGPRTEGSTPRRCPDIRKLANLGYRPKVSFEEGLPRIVEWYVANADRAPSAVERTEELPRAAAGSRVEEKQ